MTCDVQKAFNVDFKMRIIKAKLRPNNKADKIGKVAKKTNKAVNKPPMEPDQMEKHIEEQVNKCVKAFMKGFQAELAKNLESIPKVLRALLKRPTDGKLQCPRKIPNQLPKRPNRKW